MYLDRHYSHQELNQNKFTKCLSQRIYTNAMHTFLNEPNNIFRTYFIRFSRFVYQPNNISTLPQANVFIIKTLFHRQFYIFLSAIFTHTIKWESFRDCITCRLIYFVDMQRKKHNYTKGFQCGDNSKYCSDSKLCCFL